MQALFALLLLGLIGVWSLSTLQSCGESAAVEQSAKESDRGTAEQAIASLRDRADFDLIVVSEASGSRYELMLEYTDYRDARQIKADTGLIANAMLRALKIKGRDPANQGIVVIVRAAVLDTTRARARLVDVGDTTYEPTADRLDFHCTLGDKGISGKTC